MPKEPIMNSKVRRLAIETEDHPLAYKDFAGDIPKGQYGGGHVDIWDHGVWEPVGDPEIGFAKGKITFRLFGERLSGEWTLIRTQGKGEKSHWLLMQHLVPTSEDAHANHSSKVRTKNIDIRSLQPALCQLVDEPPKSDGWVHETKYDGYRFLATKLGDQVKLMTRNHLDWSNKFPTIVKSLNELLANGDVIDGEVIVTDKKGISRFRLLQEALSNEDTSTTEYFLFDILFHKYADVRLQTLLERKKLLDDLAKAWPQNSPVRVSPWIKSNVGEMLQSACKLGLEGLVSKKSDSSYPTGRTANWVKSKCQLEEEFLIIGFTEPEGQREYFGALLLGQLDPKGVLVYCGKVGTGFNERNSRDLHKKLLKIRCKDSPLNKALPPIGRRTKIFWVKPKLIAEVEYTERTSIGVLRHPVFLGLREDKAPTEVKVEVAAKASEIVTELTHPQKIMYAKTGTTKQEIAEYYQSHQDLILPFLLNRPLSLTRCPDGTDKQCFFQRNDRGMFPPVIHHKQKSGDSLMWIDDLKGLLTLVQFGVLEIHTWGCHVDDVSHPDMMVFDLDPGEGASFSQLIRAAEHVRLFMDALGLQSFVKTSGKKGLHICAPTQPNLSWDQLKEFTKTIANSLAVRYPKLYTAQVTKSKRSGRIFIDYLRNQKSATFVAPYSTRISEEPSVSMPIHWDELKNLRNASEFTIHSDLNSLDQVWPGFNGSKQEVTPKLLEQLSKWAKAA